MRAAIQWASGALGILLLALGLQGSLLPPEWSPYLVGVGVLLFIVAIVLTVEGTTRGRSIIQSIRTSVSESPANVAGAQVNRRGWFHFGSQNVTTVINPPPGAKQTDRRGASGGRRLLDQLPPDPNKRIGYVAAKDDDVKLFNTATGELLFSMIQVWFRNVDREVPITELSAEVTVTDGQDDYWRQHHSRWAIGTEPQNVGGWTETKIKIDLAPGEVGKLNVFVRHPKAPPNICRFFVENDTQSSELEVWGADRTVRIALHASGGIDRTFVFRLLNDDNAFALLIR